LSEIEKNILKKQFRTFEILLERNVMN
jgi:hypothetical protein